MSSAYKSTASVFSSCAGSGTLTRACIHPGASPAQAGCNPALPAMTARQTKIAEGRILVAGRRRCRLQHDLLFISSPNSLIEIPQRWVIFLIQEGEAASEMPLKVKRTLL